MKAAVLTEYGHINWQEVSTPPVGATQVRTQVKYASICGTDQPIFKSEFHPRTHAPHDSWA